jgi:type 1 glutamine amidotransferase
LQGACVTLISSVALLKAIHAGAGLVVFHGGIDWFAGRAFYSSLAHSSAVIRQPEVIALLMSCMSRAARSG